MEWGGERILPKVLMYLRSLGICILTYALIHLFLALKFKITAIASLKHSLRLSEISLQVCIRKNTLETQRLLLVRRQTDSLMGVAFRAEQLQFYTY